MWKAVIVVSAAFLLVGTVLKAATVLRRRRMLASIDPEEIRRVERGVSLRALLYGTGRIMGLDPRRSNRTVADLVLTGDRFLLSSGRGVLVDLGPDRGRPFTSVRCTGPGRLVIEGEIAQPGKDPGLYRFELVVPDAVGWAEALRPFVQERGDGPRYATRPPWMDEPS